MRQALILPLLLLGAAACDRQPAPAPQAAAAGGETLPALTGPVVDRADLLSPDEEARLARKAEALRREIGPQYVIVTVASLGGRPIEDYSLDLARRWGLGHKDRDDGLMLLVAPAERKVRIEVGVGLERRVTNGYAAQVIEERALPSFKAGRFPQGIEEASDALIARLRAEPDGADKPREKPVAL
ncbi:MAG TPA: TPM domain-containing protein [Allosphingosinicella sp.]